MKQVILSLLVLLMNCNQSNNLKNCKIVHENCEKEAEKLFNDYGKLKEEYEDAKTYIQLLEQENEYLKNWTCNKKLDKKKRDYAANF
ncbi:hypothetical protein [Pontimicrobium sp. MEBiC06410]